MQAAAGTCWRLFLIHMPNKSTALKTFNCSFTQKCSLTHTKHPAAHTFSAHYVHAAFIYHIQRKAISASQVKGIWGKYVGSWKVRDTMENADSEGGHSRHGHPGHRDTRGPFTWAQASSPPAQVDGQGQVDIIVALSLPAGPVERKLSILSPLQGGD